MYQIISDGSCDLGKIKSEELGIKVVPFYVTTDGKNYKKEIEEVDIREFYQFMVDNPKVFPKSSLPSIQDYVDAFEPLAKENIPIICICITTKFSGSYNSAINAKQIILEDYPNALIAVIDSIADTAFQGVLVMEAVKMQRAGYSYQEVIDKIEETKSTGRIFFTVGNMDYLVHGGRVGKLMGLAAGTLGIRPLIILKEGEIFPAGIARGRKRSMAKVIEDMIEYIKSSNLSINDFSIAVAFGYDMEEAEKFRTDSYGILKAEFPEMNIELEMLQIGATIGVHTGPYPIGFGIMKKLTK